ncbi:hypothetical protein PPYR_09852 [Photinus pyralis]|uniref:Glutathione transferase n=2 Tax=Photinus pyralis TaxID=7054 RepID=A0A5N4AEP5_PHOPY|nr:glutathione S-transferase omega-1-like [Photinus pyralis]KAB0795791.1 hypothetical protein PPYR_09852 [Photinus pyralis]
MSEKHLQKGSAFPAKSDDGKWRLYSMQYCPYAQRARIILALKNVPHEIVNVNTTNKPEWFLELNSLGKVPVLDTGSSIIPESLVICDYLDEIFPEPPLHSKDEQRRERDAALLKEFDEFLTIYHGGIRSQDEASYPACVQELTTRVAKFDEELRKRGTYFGGEKPQMIDFMLWPWAERAPIASQIFKENFPDATVFPSLYSWCAKMRVNPVLQDTKTDFRKQLKFYELYRCGGFIDYDMPI